MRNLNLISAISTELSQCLQDGLKRSDVTVEQKPIQALGEEEIQQIEAMASALQNEDNGAMTAEQRPDNQTDYAGINKERVSSSIVTINFKVPESKLTIINDLQGLDEALFRIETDGLVCKGMVASMTDLADLDAAQTIFSAKVHAKILADYFDPSVNSWKSLLEKPWELAFKSERALVSASKSGRFSTKADIHSMPMHLSFSEHFLIGLGSASRMFSMSAEMEKESRVELERSMKEKSSSVAFKPRASTTRHLVAALPYALDNFSGLDVSYFLKESQDENRSCPNGTKQYFRFNPAKGRGFGGKRLYGADVVEDLSIKLFIGDEDVIEIDRIDDQIGRPKRCHILSQDGTMLVTTVVKEGLSTVSSPFLDSPIS